MKNVFYFKVSDIEKVLNIVNLRTSIMNFDEDKDERVIRKAYDPEKRIYVFTRFLFKNNLLLRI